MTNNAISGGHSASQRSTFPGSCALAIQTSGRPFIEKAMQKKCSKCKKWKDLDAFNKCRSAHDGLQWQCRDCLLCYNASKRGIAARRRYEASEKGKANKRRYQSSEKGLLSHRRYQRDNPEKVACHNALNHAIDAGKVVRQTACSECGKGGAMHAHHEDYSKPLDVEWLCPPCHGHLHFVATEYVGGA